MNAPQPDLDDVVTSMGRVGCRLSEIGACEGAAGNISIFLGWPVNTRRMFPAEERMDLPLAVPELAGGSILVSGSGCRLREIRENPAQNLGCLTIEESGKTARLFTSPKRTFRKLTSEFNSHLAVHRDRILHHRTKYHAVVHAQPFHLTFLSHIPAYRRETYLNRRLLRWQPEMIVYLTDGIGMIPFRVPASSDLMEKTVAALRTHTIVVWAKHGVMAVSEISVEQACDRIEYADTGARYELADLSHAARADGLTAKEINSICRSLGLRQNIFR